MNKFHSLKKRISEIPTHYFLFFSVFVLAVSVLFLAEPNPTEVKPRAMDTVIPAGFVLVPIEIQNFQSLDQIFGNFGIVDLYRIPHEGQGKPQLVARGIRMIRSPKNPDHFAVLAPEQEAHQLVSAHALYQVAVQNPNKRETKIISKKLSKARRLIISEEP